MFRGRRVLGSGLRIRVRRTRWPPWCDGHRVAWLVRGWRECGRRCAGRRNERGREAGRATVRRAECGFRIEDAEEALARSCRPIYRIDSSSKEPICLCGPVFHLLGRPGTLKANVSPWRDSYGVRRLAAACFDDPAAARVVQRRREVSLTGRKRERAPALHIGIAADITFAPEWRSSTGFQTFDCQPPAELLSR